MLITLNIKWTSTKDCVDRNHICIRMYLQQFLIRLSVAFKKGLSLRFYCSWYYPRFSEYEGHCVENLDDIDSYTVGEIFVGHVLFDDG